MEEKLLVQFDVFYNEYQEYNNFFEKNQKERIANMSDTVRKLIEKEPLDIKAATEFVFENSGYPQCYAVDLNLLKERLLAVYQFIENIVEFPEEVKTEMSKLREMKDVPMFTIRTGKPEVLNQPKIDKLLAQLKSPEVIKNTVETMKNIAQFKSAGNEN